MLNVAYQLPDISALRKA